MKELGQASYLLQQANVSPNAIKVAFLATDGFATDLTIQMATQNSDILVAYQKDNQSLGGLQLVVPFHWGYKWISSLIKIQLVNYDFLGTYESQGYSDEGTISGVGPLPDFQQSQASTNPTSNPTTMTQKSTPSPTNLSPSLNPTIYPTESPVELNSQPQLTSTSPILLYIAIFFVVIVTSTLASVSILIKRKKTKSKL
jgi:hypothetical protein